MMFDLADLASGGSIRSGSESRRWRISGRFRGPIDVRIYVIVQVVSKQIGWNWYSRHWRNTDRSLLGKGGDLQISNVFSDFGGRTRKARHLRLIRHAYQVNAIIANTVEFRRANGSPRTSRYLAPARRVSPSGMWSMSWAHESRRLVPRRKTIPAINNGRRPERRGTHEDDRRRRRVEHPRYANAHVDVHAGLRGVHGKEHHESGEES